VSDIFWCKSIAAKPMCKLPHYYFCKLCVSGGNGGFFVWVVRCSAAIPHMRVNKDDLYSKVLSVPTVFNNQRMILKYYQDRNHWNRSSAFSFTPLKPNWSKFRFEYLEEFDAICETAIKRVRWNLWLKHQESQFSLHCPFQCYNLVRFGAVICIEL
jgi:hypothetical protein